MTEHISILQGYIDHLEFMKKNAYDFFDREQADKDIEAFKAAIKALEQEPCEDAISRQAAIDAVMDLCKHYTPIKSVNHPHIDFVIEALQDIPPVNLQPKVGHWILTSDDDYEYCTCSECGYQNGENWMIGSHIKFCQECGARMVEPQESEE